MFTDGAGKVRDKYWFNNCLQLLLDDLDLEIYFLRYFLRRNLTETS